MSAIKTSPHRVPTPPEPTNGSSPAGQRVGVGRQRRMSWIMLGLLLSAGAALAFVLVLSSTGNRVAVVVAARDLQPGQQIKATDLRSVSISSDDSVKTVAADRSADLVGRVPTVPLAAGTFLHGGMFAAGSDLAASETVVGAALRPGDVPGNNLRPGDRVALVQVASNNPTDTGESMVLGVGAIYSVSVPKDSGDIAVAVRVPIEQGVLVANAAGQKRLRLLLVPPDATIDQLAVPDATKSPTGSGSVLGASSGSGSNAPKSPSSSATPAKGK